MDLDSNLESFTELEITLAKDFNDDIISYDRKNNEVFVIDGEITEYFAKDDMYN